MLTLKIGCDNVAQGHVTTKVVSDENHSKQRFFLILTTLRKVL